MRRLQKAKVNHTVPRRSGISDQQIHIYTWSFSRERNKLHLQISRTRSLPQLPLDRVIDRFHTPSFNIKISILPP
ncbi:hypothetical protein BDD12DRAFT_857136 [Trichophaea hybrida]|nr:hypothetical protein BDD12DRAFT_857136 [Trichophaea hybrida]